LRDRYGKGLEALRYLEALETATYEIEEKMSFILGMDRDDLAFSGKKVQRRSE
jgi:hypothetical protein